MLPLREALIYSLAIAAVILFCRAAPFLLLRGRVEKIPLVKSILDFIESAAPPVVMTVLALSSLVSPFTQSTREGLINLIPGIAIALFHLWKRNFMISVVGGTALYMLLQRL